MKQLTLALAPDCPPVLENFVPGDNGELLAALAGALGGAERFVYLWGEPGSGRSHLLHGFVAAARARGLRAAYAAGAVPEEEGLEAVAVDEVERLDPAAQIALFNLYNRLRESGGRLVAAGPCPSARLDLRPDVVTRLGWGLAYQVHPLGDAAKRQALRDRAAARGFELPEAAADYLLTRWKRDLPSLLGALDTLDRYSLERQRPITIPLLKDALREETGS